MCREFSRGGKGRKFEQTRGQTDCTKVNRERLRGLVFERRTVAIENGNFRGVTNFRRIPGENRGDRSVSPARPIAQRWTDKLSRFAFTLEP